MKIKTVILPIFAAIFIAGCGGGINILPEPFTRERADGKIPVKVELIREQVWKELTGKPEGEAEVERWQAIETDYNSCRLSSARATKSEAEEVFAVCMSQRDYVYMYPVDAEQFHNDIFFAMRKEKEESERLAEERRIAAEKKAEEERIAAEEKAEEERIAAEKKAEEERIARKKWLEEEIKKSEQKRLVKNLMMYAGDGELSEVRRLLSLGVNPNAIDDDGETALHIAAINGHVEVVKMLLAAGADLEVKGGIFGMTALIYATNQEHAEVAKILLSAGADVNAVGTFGSTALMNAAAGRHTEIVKMLLSAGANPNAANSNDGTALKLAAIKGRTENVKVLLDAGANPYAVDDQGRTPLIWASRNGQNEIVKMLLAEGADVNAADKLGYTALILAANNVHAEVLKILLAAGANPNAVDRNGYTALVAAIHPDENDSYKFHKIAEHINVINILLAAGANPNNGRVPALIFAVEKLYFEIAEILLKAKANPNHVIRDGLSIMDNAIYDNHPDMIELLRRYGGVCRKYC